MTETMTATIATQAYLAQRNRHLTVSKTPGPNGVGGGLEPPLFDPERGTTVMLPLGEGTGWWVGAPSAFWDGERTYLAYRTRRPQPERGGLFQIAVSKGGVTFEPIWQVRKEDLGTSSIERGALLRTPEGRWRLYLSFVDPADDRWRIDLLEADTPDGFRADQRVPILTATDIDGEGVKDPWVAQLDDGWVMIASYAPKPSTPDAQDSSRLHGTRDVYNTGLIKSCTGLATSADGLTWTWHGPILEPVDGQWDAYAARINTVVRTDGGFMGLYDGSKSVTENYEERCAVVVSPDLHSWERLGPNGPIVGAAGGPGTVRYAEAVQGDGWIRYYYEFTRPDGSHELRTSLVRQ